MGAQSRDYPVFGRWRLDVRSGEAHFDADAIAMYDVGLEETSDPAYLREHMHPDDAPRLAKAAAEALKHPVPVTETYRVRTFTRGERTFIVAADPVTVEGQVVGLSGYTIDVTDWSSATTSDTVARAMESRAAVEQVKGALIAIYNLDESLAMEVLRLRAEHADVPLPALASRAMARLTDRQDRIRRHEGGLPLLRLLDEVAAELTR